MKRLLAATGAVVAAASMAGPALAGGHHNWSTLTVQSNIGSQKAVVVQNSSVEQKGGHGFIAPTLGLGLSGNGATVGQTLIQVNK